jgi:large subunit ribosomal protein L22
MEEAGLFVKTITVDGGMMLKRLVQPRVVHRIRKRSNHVTIVLDLLITHKQFNKDGTKDKSNWK